MSKSLTSNYQYSFVYREYYLISAQWVGKENSHVGVVWMNRAQNLTIYSSCYAPNWTCTEVHFIFKNIPKLVEQN